MLITLGAAAVALACLPLVGLPAAAAWPWLFASTRRGLIGGALVAFSYGVALWAMTLAPIALVAALRETSVLFGAIIAVVLLKEPLRIARMIAAVLIVCGLVLIRLQYTQAGVGDAVRRGKAAARPRQR